MAPLATALLLATALVAGPSAAVARPPATSCPPGRFLLAAGGAAARGLPQPVAITIDGPSVAMDVACSDPVVRVVATAARTRVRARWTHCNAGPGSIRLRASIAAPACERMTGVLGTGRARPRRFTATRSACGDGRRDPEIEECDAGVGCGAGEMCTAACHCRPPTSEPPASATTTTTTLRGSTTTTPDGSTTTTTTPGPGCHVEDVPPEPNVHVPVGTPIAYEANPPASGPHYPVWAKYRDHARMVPRGYWLHNLEHGAVVIVWRPDAPADDVDALHAAYAAIPPDDSCNDTTTRALMTPDPYLPDGTPFAVLAEYKRMRCSGVPDTQSMLDFVAQFRRRTSGEHVCSDGDYPPGP